MHTLSAIILDPLLGEVLAPRTIGGRGGGGGGYCGGCRGRCGGSSSFLSFYLSFNLVSLSMLTLGPVVIYPLLREVLLPSTGGGLLGRLRLLRWGGCRSRGRLHALGLLLYSLCLPHHAHRPVVFHPLRGVVWLPSCSLRRLLWRLLAGGLLLGATITLLVISSPSGCIRIT